MRTARSSLPASSIRAVAFKGELQSYAIGRSHAVQLKASPNESVLAIMVAVQLVGIGPDVIQISGLERHGDAWMRQQWICRVKPRPPQEHRIS